MGVIVWRDSMLSLGDVETRKYESADVERYYSEMGNLTLDGYVVNDYHVNRSMGLGHFAKNGGYVKDEDLSLMDDPKAYKDFYVEMKVKADTDKKQKPRKKAVRKWKPKRKAAKRSSSSRPTSSLLITLMKKRLSRLMSPCYAESFEGCDALLSRPMAQMM